ncbi:tetratricopeptide repeat protein [Brachyspira hyodysenteriae]|uniref:tetratricopeptide repeat protein n=1 Tax=Brachyspira hyodysenteriae TaxID=159 RepID=UPI0022CD38DE|nr:tetratricopeptide repeat protein [Brachyspira hyodysenteriae]MCZ9850025.1 tetratricopeptide repeat protein [Brachyspira hyodysenteriae]MCZ9861152.1 tetratricopeptide repeat protein [Brachyspira hyodysenteriae]MCZ9894555.1 tetratricopeptide repeat protein [Brachyspira hyodysenteriae]MCZ9917723.1 tetratricopeptide repeat protein [Brachyspira hyodysenteriae]MCZ9921930.1 tetratricopeptide repeat protein [Brachyspira hyodysenteriae]
MTEELKDKIEQLAYDSIEKYNDDEYLYFNRGLEKIESKLYEEAIEDFNKIIELNPKDRDAYFFRGLTKTGLKLYEEAIEDFNKIIELNPKDRDAYFFRGLTKTGLKLYEEAIEDFNEAIKLNLKNWESYFARGVSKSSLKLYEEAIVDFNKTIKLNPKNEKAYFNRGIAKIESKKYGKDIEDFNKAIELNPDNEEAYFNRGIAKVKLARYEEAIVDFNKSIELNPKNEKAYFNRGIEKIKLARYEEAIVDFNKAIKLNKNYEKAYSNRGIAKVKLARYEKAIVDFNKSIELNPDNEEAYSNRGIAKVKLARYEEAIVDFNKVIELNPNDENAYLVRGVLKIILEIYEEAIVDFNKTIKLNPKNEKAYYYRGILKIKLKKYKQAINDFKIFAKNNNDASDITIIKILQEFNKYNDIDKFFKLLIIDENKELWQNEPISNLIFHFKESKKFDNELIKNIKYLILYEYFLLKILSFDTDDKNIEISHYTSLDILLILLGCKNENSDEVGNIRINNISTANDPKEGNILESIFNRNDINIKIGSDEKIVTLQTSYSRNRDSLTMFRLYGKKENKEATGICLVLDNEYFTNSYTSPFSYYDFNVSNEDKEKTKKEEYTTNKRNLYWVLYYDEKLNKLVFNKEDLKYSSNIIDLNEIKKYRKKLKEDDTLEDKIKYAFSKIFEYTRKIKEKKINPKLYNYLFENIKYIIKHEAFFEEQELRMLVTSDYKSKEIKADKINNKLYIDYLKLFDKNTNYIKEIIIGSKVENNESLAEYIRKILHEKNTDKNKLDDIKVIISEAPLR